MYMKLFLLRFKFIDKRENRASHYVISNFTENRKQPISLLSLHGTWTGCNKFSLLKMYSFMLFFWPCIQWGKGLKLWRAQGYSLKLLLELERTHFRENVVKFGFSRKARLCLILATDKNVREHFRERSKYNVVSPNSTYILGWSELQPKDENFKMNITFIYVYGYSIYNYFLHLRLPVYLNKF